MLRTHRSLKAYCACDEDEEKDDQSFSYFQGIEHRWNEIERGKPKYRIVYSRGAHIFQKI
jgi:hypothetical protein